MVKKKRKPSTAGNQATVTAPAVNATPGGVGTPVQPLEEPCLMPYHGELNDVYLGLNVLDMPHMLEKLGTFNEDEFRSIRENVGSGVNVGVARLRLAISAVWYRKWSSRPYWDTDRENIKAGIEITGLPSDQNDAIRDYVNASHGPPAHFDNPVAAPTGPPGDGTPYPDSVLSAFGTEEQTAFKRAVYNGQVQSRLKAGKVFHPGLPADQLATVERGATARKDAAAAFIALLGQARLDLETDKTANDALANAVKSFGVSSGHRSAAEELVIWQSVFVDYYRDRVMTKARRKADGGEHGPAAVKILVDHFLGYKAAPGFSNHTLGVAVDFVLSFTTPQPSGDPEHPTSQLGASGSQNALWLASWLHSWLRKHAATYGIHPIPTEAWHWEYTS